MRGGYGGSRNILCDVCFSSVSMIVLFEEGNAGHAADGVNLCSDR